MGLPQADGLHSLDLRPLEGPRPQGGVGRVRATALFSPIPSQGGWWAAHCSELGPCRERCPQGMWGPGLWSPGREVSQGPNYLLARWSGEAPHKLPDASSPNMTTYPDLRASEMLGPEPPRLLLGGQRSPPSGRCRTSPAPSLVTNPTEGEMAMGTNCGGRVPSHC